MRVLSVLKRDVTSLKSDRPRLRNTVSSYFSRILNIFLIYRKGEIYMFKYREDSVYQ